MSLQGNVNYRPSFTSNVKFIDYWHKFKISHDTKTSCYKKYESSHKIFLHRYFLLPFSFLLRYFPTPYIDWISKQNKNRTTNRKIFLHLFVQIYSTCVSARVPTTCVSHLIRPFSSLAFDLFTLRVRSLQIKVHVNGFTWSRYHRTWRNQTASVHFDRSALNFFLLRDLKKYGEVYTLPLFYLI